MNILFIHRTFPAQFKFLATALTNDPNNLVMFITANDYNDIKGIHKILYKPKEIHSNVSALKDYAENLAHAEAVAGIALSMKNKGLIPDIIYGISWGCSLFIKDIFPDVPFVCYFEWMTNPEGAAVGFDGKLPDFDYRRTIKYNHATALMDLCSCDVGISPTQWQKSQFLTDFQDKIQVLHDGIDTTYCTPDKNAKFLIPDKNLELTAKDEVVTYATRGMEPFRGFPQFMEAVSILQKKRPNTHFVIGGEDAVYYGEPLKNGTYKELMLKQHKYDLDKIHFVGSMNYDEYINLLRVSSAHIYLTYPFVLSWSILEAMSCECCIIASNTSPVLEVIEDNYNGLLVDFFNVNKLVEKIEYALELKFNNKEKIQTIKENARKTIAEKYSLQTLLPKHFDFINSTIKLNRERKK